MIEAILDIMQMICKHTPTIKYRYIGIVVLNFAASPLHFPSYNVQYIKTIIFGQLWEEWESILSTWYKQ